MWIDMLKQSKKADLIQENICCEQITKIVYQ